MKSFLINGSTIHNLDDFYNQIEELFLKKSDLNFWRNLDALADILSGWFWSFEISEPIEIIWEKFEESQKYLENIDIIEEIFTEQENITFKKA